MQMPRKIKICIVQFAPLSYEREKNLSKALSLASKAVSEGAKIIALPELFDSGYCVEDRDKEFSIDFSNLNHPTLKALFDFAKKYEVVFIACSIEKQNDKLFDTAYIISKQGLIGKYNKIYLWGDEKKRFCRGKEYPVFELEIQKGLRVKIGLQICYEIGFAEGARFLALKGAELLFYPSAFGKVRAYVWDLASRARALENGVFVLAINRSKEEFSKLSEQNLYFGGKSKIINPKGEVLKELLEDEGYILENLDLDELKIQRETLPYLKDINLKLNQKILENLNFKS